MANEHVERRERLIKELKGLAVLLTILALGAVLLVTYAVTRAGPAPVLF